MRYLLICIALLILTGCAEKRTILQVCPDMGEHSYCFVYIDTQGASLVTSTEQSPEGKLDLEIPLAP